MTEASPAVDKTPYRKHNAKIAYTEVVVVLNHPQSNELVAGQPFSHKLVEYYDIRIVVWAVLVSTCRIPRLEPQQVHKISYKAANCMRSAGQDRPRTGRNREGQEEQGRTGQGCFSQRLACRRPLTSLLTPLPPPCPPTLFPHIRMQVCRPVLDGMMHHAHVHTSMCSQDVHECLAQQ